MEFATVIVLLYVLAAFTAITIMPYAYRFYQKKHTHRIAVLCALLAGVTTHTIAYALSCFIYFKYFH